MPTLNRRRGRSDSIHPQQTEFYINARLPTAGYITYQVDHRAKQFLVDDLGYDDGDELPWGLVYPLRQIRDLFTLNEGRPRPTDDVDHSRERVSVPDLPDVERAALVDYLETHPDISGDLGAFETRLIKRDESYLDAIRRNDYTPVKSIGFDSSGNESLDRIAERYFGDRSSDYIEWNGERIYEYIVVHDREGNRHEFPKIESRIPEGERLRLSRALYERWGSEIGASEVNSRMYDPEDEEFPNEWIGQREGAPEPTLERAKSPRAFFYRTIAGRSGYAPGNEVEVQFEQACDYSLEVYKANFPTAVDPGDLETEYVVVEEHVEPWHDFQVPPGWIQRYAETGGLPPLKRTDIIPDHLDSTVRSAIERHTPGGDGETWFESVEEAVDHFGDWFYGGPLLVADQSELTIENFRIGGAAGPIFDLKIDGFSGTLRVFPEGCQFRIESRVAGTHLIESQGRHIVRWDLPETDTPTATHGALVEQRGLFDSVVGIVRDMVSSFE